MKLKITKHNIPDLMLLTIISGILSTNGFLKYLVVILISMILLLKNRKINITLEIKGILYPIVYYVLIGIMIAILSGNVSIYTFKQIAFYSVPCLFSIALYSSVSLKRFKKMTQIQFWSILIIFLIKKIPEYNPIDLLESELAFVFGAYILYFIYLKKNFNVSIAIIALILAHKRIVIVAIVIVTFIYYIIDIFKEVNKRKVLMSVYIVFIGLAFFLIYFIKSGEFLLFVREYQINTQGRADYIYPIFNDLYSFSIFFSGRGIGYVLNVLHVYPLKNLHNDILAMFIEIGFVGSIIYFYLYKLFFDRLYIRKGERIARFIMLLFIYTFILYISDNVSIYISYLIPFYMIILSSRNNDEISQNTKKIQNSTRSNLKS
ncbi:hypothetical protein C8U37_10239 [Trichococcus patagoniensis]|uniref:O-antigen ligase-related domain-containing protein n=1 Tax=Trichococcus patagoniensis TaxID=382641 RepID=A0A2T5IQ45_9LACT|nr:O-antigen ligase family protein [Trichococcus patagoniensis]PTQ85936.1 hypothetical protein C8U37_10239 [Trichococcus patagoniensis]